MSNLPVKKGEGNPLEHSLGDVFETAKDEIENLEGRQAAAQADSTATTVSGIVSDFNALLAKLRAANLMQ